MKIVGWLCIVAVLSSVQASYAWRSSLYPESWTPDYKDAQGRFLHDFSYAGYWKGEKPIPANPHGTTYTVTDAPYFADNTGTSDATAAIQSAIDAAGVAGGGIVYLPAGTYKVAPGANSYALRIVQNGVVLRGAGTNQTFICNTDTVMRGKSVILVQPASGGDWHADSAVSNYMARTDIVYPTRTIPLTSVSGLATGDLVVVRADCTDDFVADHGMTGLWGASLQGPTILRTITAIDAAATNVMIDIPTRYYHKTRDNARLYKVGAQLEEVGLEDFSIGMLQNDSIGWGDEDYSVVGTGAYEVHGSRAMYFLYARNCWVQRVATYKPAANTKDIHMLSNVLRLTENSHMTVSECTFQKPQYEGGGGNGYGFITQSADSLVIDCVVYHCRHNYDFGSMHTTGNVIYRSVGISPRYSSDFHMHLSMANMFDSMRLDGDWLQAVYRPYGTAPALHGHPTTESVFWNTHSDNSQSGKAVESRQWGNGYIVGTSGNTPTVSLGTADNTAPEDFLEGQGTGETLEPQSLYADQFAKRMQGVLVDAGGDVMLPVTNGAVSISGSTYSYGYETPSSVWSQVSGPLAPIADSNALNTTVAILTPGSYTFRLTAFDAAVTNQDEVVVEVLENIATLASKDYIVGESDGPALAYYVDGASSMIGAGGAVNSRTDQVVILGYALPTLPVGTTITGAVFNFEITTARDSSGSDPALHVYLLDTANPDGTGTSFFYHGASNTTADAKFAGQTYCAVGDAEKTFADDEYDVSFTLSGDALALLESFYGGDHIPDQPEAFFRLNLSVNPTVLPSTQYNRYRVDLADDESWLQIQPSEALGAIPWSGLATVDITTTGAVATASVNTNLTGVWLVWDTADRGGVSTNHWPVGNRVMLGPQSVGMVTGTLANLVADSPYVWRFYGETAATNGWTPAQEFSTALSAAQTPVFTNAVALSGTSIQLQWRDLADHETGYILRRSTNALSGFVDVITLPANSTAYTDTGLTDSTTYYYQLAATNSANGSFTAFSLCQTDVTTFTQVVGALVSRDYILGRSQTADPPLGYNVEVVSGQLGVGGSTGSRYDRIPVLGFALPTLPVGTTVSNAALHFEITGVRDDSGRDPSLHVYILHTSDPDGSGTNFFYHGPINPTAEAIFIDGTFIDSPTGVSTNFADDAHDQAYTLSGDALSLLQSFYGGDHIPDQQEVFFRFNHSLVPLALDHGDAYDRYFVDTALDESSLLIMPTAPTSDDTDNDGIPDAWELEHFGSLTNSAGVASDDYDGDGFSDRHEYLAGTNPTNALSRLAFTSGTQGLSSNEFVISWSAVSGKMYRIIGTTNLLDGPWITNATGIGGIEPLNVHTVNTTESGMFYRIELE